MKPSFDLDKIKFATDQQTFDKAVDLYERGKVTKLEEGIGAYSAIVLGTRPYSVSIEARRFGFGNCKCYLGQQDTLCKHMVALSICVVMDGQKLTNEEKNRVGSPVCTVRNEEN